MPPWKLARTKNAPSPRQSKPAAYHDFVGMQTKLAQRQSEDELHDQQRLHECQLAEVQRDTAQHEHAGGKRLPHQPHRLTDQIPPDLPSRLTLRRRDTRQTGKDGPRRVAKAGPQRADHSDHDDPPFVAEGPTRAAAQIRKRSICSQPGSVAVGFLRPVADIRDNFEPPRGRLFSRLWSRPV
jgi:hypothetical protein